MIEIPETHGQDDPEWLDIAGLEYVHRAVIDEGRGVALLRANEATFSPHAHAGHRLNLVLAGHESEWCRGSLREVGPGSITFVPAGETHHSSRGRGPMRYLTVALPGNLPSGSGEHVLGRSLLAPLLWRMVCAVDDGSPDPLVVDSLHAEIEAAMHRTSWASGRDPGWLRDVFERIADEPMGIESVSGLARDVGVHRCHLARSVRARSGRSIGELLIARRLEHAARRLARTAESLADIALDLGFYDQSHFGRLFRRRFGTTPARFRRTIGRAGRG